MTNPSASVGAVAMRVGHTATGLPNGDVLVVGGHGLGGVLSSAEVYRAVEDLWISAEDSGIQRSGQSAVALANGDVLLTGGYGGAGVTASAGLYHWDRATGLTTWRPSASLPAPRANHTTTLLPNGQVLLVGGQDNVGTPLMTAVLYDPVADAWTLASSMVVPRVDHTVTLLTGGQVLVSGGRDANGVHSVVEVYDPQTGMWTAGGSLIQARAGHRAVVLQDGDVLVVGGFGFTNVLATVERYHADLATGIGVWSPAAELGVARALHGAVSLSTNSVLVSGGIGTDGQVTSSELYDGVADRWNVTGSLSVPRASHTSTLLHDGSVVIVGGTALRPGLSTAERSIPGVQAVLNWDRVSDAAVLGYKIYFGTEPNSYRGTVLAGREGQFVFGNLVRGAHYYFAVTSFSNSSESCASKPVNIVIP